MDGREAVLGGGVILRAARILVFALGGAFAAGCTSDASSICERLKECNLLPEGYSVAKCENDVSRDIPDEQQADCSACLERKACESAVEECRNDCEPK